MVRLQVLQLQEEERNPAPPFTSGVDLRSRQSLASKLRFSLVRWLWSLPQPGNVRLAEARNINYTIKSWYTGRTQ